MAKLGVDKSELGGKGNDWPKYLPKGTEVIGAFVSIGDRGVRVVASSSNSGRNAMWLPLKFRILSDDLNGFHVNDDLHVACDAEGYHGSEGAKKYLGGFVNALGIDLDEWEIPENAEEAEQMVNGEGKWKDSGLINRLVKMRAGEPNSYTNDSGELKGPYTTFGFLNPIGDPSKCTIEAGRLFQFVNDQKVAAGASGLDMSLDDEDDPMDALEATGLVGVDEDDDLPF